MQPELPDLLREAALDAPPPRYDVDDAVRAGKRRQNRRRAVVATAAVVAVAAAIGVPQLTTHRADRPVTPVATPTPDDGTPKAAYTFRGFVVGAYHVTEPASWSFNSQRADIRDAADDPVGVLIVYRRGVDPNGDQPTAPERTPTDPIGGRPAWFQGKGELYWEYADGAYATISPQSFLFSGPKAHLSDPARIRKVAEAFRTTVPYPITLPFRADHAPAGFQLSSVNTASSDDTYSVGVDFTRTQRVRAELTNPHTPRWTADDSYSVIFSGWTPTSGEVPAARSKPSCSVRGTRICGLALGTFHLTANGPATSNGEQEKILAGIDPVAQPRDASSWITVDDALPASTRIGR